MSTPCRVADTRGNGFGGAYGPPSLVANANRNFTIIGQCGIPTGAAAVSFNFGALNVGGEGDLRVFPGGRRPPARFDDELQREHSQHRQRRHRPSGRAEAITVRADAVPVDLIIDVNGYYYDYFRALGVLGLNEQFNIRTICDGCSGLYGENASTVGGSRALRGFETGASGTVLRRLGRDGEHHDPRLRRPGDHGADVGDATANYSFSSGVVGEAATASSD